MLTSAHWHFSNFVCMLLLPLQSKQRATDEWAAPVDHPVAAPHQAQLPSHLLVEALNEHVSRIGTVRIVYAVLGGSVTTHHRAPILVTAKQDRDTSHSFNHHERICFAPLWLCSCRSGGRATPPTSSSSTAWRCTTTGVPCPSSTLWWVRASTTRLRWSTTRPLCCSTWPQHTWHSRSVKEE